MTHALNRAVVAHIGLIFVLVGSLALVPSAFASHRPSVPTCTCSARMSFERPQLNFSADGISFTPRVNISLRLRGDTAGPKHTIGITYSGQTSNESEDMSVPDGVTFSGERTLLNNASCEGRWDLKGVELERLTLPGLTRTMVGDGQTLEGHVQTRAEITGCGEALQNRAFSFTMRDRGRLSIGSWRPVR